MLDVKYTTNKIYIIYRKKCYILNNCYKWLCYAVFSVTDAKIILNTTVTNLYKWLCYAKNNCYSIKHGSIDS